LAAAAAASGITLTKDISVLDGSSVGSRTMNGTPALSTPFTNLGPTDSHTAGVGPTPRVSVSLPYDILLAAVMSHKCYCTPTLLLVSTSYQSPVMCVMLSSPSKLRYLYFRPDIISPS